MELIDVVTCTWNSGKHLEECLLSIKKNVSVNKIIVVDRHSNDDTIEICKKFNCEIIQADVNLGQARKIGIDNVTTETFAFIDSDYIVCNNWYEKMQKYWNNDIGMLSGLHEIISPIHEYEKYRNFNLNSKKLIFYDVGSGGGTENTLIRKDLVKDVNIPTKISSREDWIIAEHIKSKGFSVGTAPVFSKHYTENPFKQYLWTGGGARRLHDAKIGISYPLSKNIFRLFKKSAEWLIVRKDVKISILLIRFAFLLMKGYITNYGYPRNLSE